MHWVCRVQQQGEELVVLCCLVFCGGRNLWLKAAGGDARGRCFLGSEGPSRWCEAGRGS